MRDMLRPLAIQNLKKSAEDCYAVGTLNCFCYMGVFDGCGGLGCQQISFQSEAFPNHTSAWIASRIGAAVVESFFRENGNQSFSRETVLELEQVLNETFQTLKKKYWKDDGVSGSMRRNFPTTASIIVENLQEQNVFFLWSGDSRGYFMETYNYNDFKEAGIDVEFVQDNQSSSHKGVLRGLHFQINYPQDKLVRVVNGEVFDVAVDLREGSETYGKWFGVVLSAENKKQFFIPKGFAHGFLVLSEHAEFVYKCSDFYHPNDEGGLIWNDPDIGVEWPIPEGMELSFSDKDTKWGSFKEYRK